MNVVELSLFQEELPVFEAIGEEETARPHEGKDVAEHFAIPVNEVMLFEGVQDDGNAAVKHLSEPGLRESGSIEK